MSFHGAINTLTGLVDLGGPVVALLLGLSVLSGAVVLYKFWQFAISGVGRHRGLERALHSWQRRDQAAAMACIARERSFATPLLQHAMQAAKAADRPTGLGEALDAEAEATLARLESGFRLLDSIAQVAPLLGLFGTVLGMIDAFRGLQEAGSNVDPSILAGGIWVALLTTAVGLAVAMPTSLLLTWFESRVARERIFLDRALQRLLTPAPLAHRPQDGPVRLDLVHAP